MRVDFYQLSRDPVERVVPMLAGKILDTGAKALVVAPADRLKAISDALWEADGFLANGLASDPDAARQPILLSHECEAPNEASFVVIADGQWREEAGGFARALLLFDEQATDEARQLWKAFQSRDDVEQRIFKQQRGGGWREGR